LAAACGRGAATDRPAGKPDLLFVTIDTLRADRVGRGLTPTLDALASRGVQFLQARAAVPLTLPSHVTMMTGALPPAHGVRENGTHVFSGAPVPVAQQLKGAGYKTAAFVGAYVLDRRFGLAAGLDRGRTGVRPGSDRGRTGVRPGSDRGRIRVGSGSDRGQSRL
jgi:hypothetical protein